jgi:acyl-CoA thioesterase FadM
VQVEYRASARFGETVRVACWVTRLRSRHVTFDYLVTEVVSGATLATGRTEHICVDEAGRMARIPAPVLERLTSGLARLAAGAAPGAVPPDSLAGSGQNGAGEP